MIETKVEKIYENDKKKEGKVSFFLYINNQIPNLGKIKINLDLTMNQISEKHKG
jgi:hypothetical protein